MSESRADIEKKTGTPGRPALTADKAAELVSRHFGITGSLTDLPSDRDQNFLVSAKDGHRYVFKIANADEDAANLDAQAKALHELKSGGLPVPEILPSVSGNMIVHIRLSGTAYLARLISYLEGTPLAKIRPKTNTICQRLGEVMGDIDAVLCGFDHAAVHRTSGWDVLQALETVRENMVFVGDPSEKRLLEDFCSRFASEVIPQLDDLPRQVIHADANDYNVLVSGFVDGANPEWSRHISGVIDFGDLIHSLRIAEVAIAATYAMMDMVDPISTLCALTAGYHKKSPLLESELNVLFDLVRARLCITASMSAKQKLQEPDNEYLRISEKPAWKLLDFVSRYSPELATYRVRAACGFEPFSGGERLVAWLRDQEGSFSPVIAPDPRTNKSLVFDFSVGTLEWGPADMAEPLSAGKELFRRMRKADAAVGVGRYNEARTVYSGTQYEEADSEMRTIHIGLDLFQEPGKPVFSPMNGLVFSVKNGREALDYGPVVVLQHAPQDGPVFYTLYGHLSEDSVDDLTKGQMVAAGDQIACLGTSEENGGWVPHLHFQIIGDMLDSEDDFFGVALASQRKVWTSICPDPNLIVGIPRSAFPVEPLGAAEIERKRTAFLGPPLNLSYRSPVHFVRGFMQHLIDADGQAFLDAINNVPHVGHSHPHVVEAACRQLTTLNTNTRYLHENIVRYAERLAATMPDPLSVVYLVNSGSEANDLALRLARAATGGQTVITIEGAYHGHISSLIDISPYKYDGPGGQGAAKTTHAVAMPDSYRGKHRGHSPDTGRAYADFVEEAADRMANLAAFICEPALGCGGQIFLPPTYLEHAFAAVRAHGGVCIADEIQVGMGRLGTHFWGFQTHGVVPDIVTIGKPIGNGHPLGAVVTTREIASAFDNGMEYFNTFGGNPVSCAIGLAVLDVLDEQHLQENALNVGEHLRRGLELLGKNHAIIGDVRGRGLFLGIELVRDQMTLEPAAREASYLVDRLRDRRILTSTDGPLQNVIKIKPPLVFTAADADFLVDQIADILKDDYLQA